MTHATRIAQLEADVAELKALLLKKPVINHDDLKAEYLRRIAQGEKNLVIINGKIVVKQPYQKAA